MSKIILINQRTDKYGKFKEKRDNLDVRFQLQIHKFIWEENKKGV